MRFFPILSLTTFCATFLNLTTVAAQTTIDFDFDSAFELKGAHLPSSSIKAGECYTITYLPDVYQTPDGKKYELYRMRPMVLREPQYNYEQIELDIPQPDIWVRRPDVVPQRGLKLVDPIYQSKSVTQPLTEAVGEWRIRTNMTNFPHHWRESMVGFCLTEHPAQYQTLITAPKEIRPPSKMNYTDTVALSDEERYIYYMWVGSSTKKATVTRLKNIVKGQIEFIEANEIFAEGLKPIDELPANAKLVKKGGLSALKPIQAATVADKVKKVQKALHQAGYYDGEMDNQLTPRTKAALVQFQKDNQLPTGTLDDKTLEALGL